MQKGDEYAHKRCCQSYCKAEDECRDLRSTRTLSSSRDERDVGIVLTSGSLRCVGPRDAIMWSGPAAGWSRRTCKLATYCPTLFAIWRPDRARPSPVAGGGGMTPGRRHRPL